MAGNGLLTLGRGHLQKKKDEEEEEEVGQDEDEERGPKPAAGKSKRYGSKVLNDLGRDSSHNSQVPRAGRSRAGQPPRRARRVRASSRPICTATRESGP